MFVSGKYRKKTGDSNEENEPSIVNAGPLSGTTEAVHNTNTDECPISESATPECQSQKEQSNESSEKTHVLQPLNYSPLVTCNLLMRYVWKTWKMIHQAHLDFFRDLVTKYTSPIFLRTNFLVMMRTGYVLKESELFCFIFI